MGAPCTAGKRDVIWTARMVSLAFMGRIDTTRGPCRLRVLAVAMLVRYMGTFLPWLIWRMSMPLANRAYSNENEQTIANNTRRSEEHTSELQSLMSISYAVFCLKQKTN